MTPWPALQVLQSMVSRPCSRWANHFRYRENEVDFPRTRSLQKRTWFLFSQKFMQRAKIERRFEVCPISEFFIYYAEFMVILGLLGILRRTLSSHWKGFHGSSAPKTFDHTQQAVPLTTMFSPFEVHVFNRECCLQEFLIEAVERPPEQSQVLKISG